MPDTTPPRCADCDKPLQRPKNPDAGPRVWYCPNCDLVIDVSNPPPPKFRRKDDDGAGGS